MVNSQPPGSCAFVMTDYQVLVIGPRRGLIEVLQARGIPFSVWQEKRLYRVDPPHLTLTAPFSNSITRIREQVRRSFPGQRFTHVIAGTEAGVMVASVARRLLGARPSSTVTSSRCRDKFLMKQHLSGFGIPMTRFMADTADLSAEELFAALGTPLVRKWRKSSGGRGIEYLRTAQEFREGSHEHCLLERFVDAPEASIESFIGNGSIRFTSITGYEVKGHTNYVPAQLDGKMSMLLRDLNTRVIEALRIPWGMTHLEVYLTPAGPLFGEIALRPPGGYIMNALQHAWEFNPWEAFVAMELGEDFVFPQQPSAWAAAEVLHPGPGKVAAVRGKQQVLSHEGVREFRIKVKAGDQVEARSALGQDAGFVVHVSDTAEQRRELHDFIMDTLGFNISPSQKA